MSEDELSALDGKSEPASFDFDEDAIAALLDTFVETQTGPRLKRISRPSDPSDSGAQAAQRTVFQHRSRHETLPLVGDAPETKIRRIELLEALADGVVGSARARLLTSAAELYEQLGNRDGALRSYERALHSDARDVVVLRALRRLAMQRGDWAAAATALKKEAGLELSAVDRGSALKLLARIQLSKLGDPAAAEQSATRATALRPTDFVPWVLTAAARLARGDAVRAAEALVSAAERWPDAEAKAVVFMHAARLMEGAHALDQAQSAYRRALELQPASLAARLGMVRTARGLGATGTAVELLLAASESASDCVAAALRRMAVGLSDGIRAQQAGAVRLDRADDTASLWTEAEAAAIAGDDARAIAALSASSSDATPEIRAVSSARRARLHAERGERADFEHASMGAQHEASLEGYLHAWTRFVAVDADAGSEIRGWLEALSAEAMGTSSRMAHADDMARRGDGRSFIASLGRELDGVPAKLAAGAALAIAEIATLSGATDRETALLRAEERAPDDAVIRWALLAQDDDPERCARRWTDEGGATRGARSAFAFTMGARSMPAGSVGAIEAGQAALTRQPGYWPALWELEDKLGSPAARTASAAMQATLDSEEASTCRLRASMWAPEASEREALAQGAVNVDALDPLLVEHLVDAMGGATEAAGDLLLSAARAFGSASYLERASAAYRWAALPERAAEVLREASAKRPDDPFLRVQRKDAELHASEFARLTDDAMRRAREAADDADRLGALAAIAELDWLDRRDMRSARLSLQSIAEMRPEHIPTARSLESDALRENDPERIRGGARRLAKLLPIGSPDQIARQRLVLELLRSDPDTMQSDIDRLLQEIERGLQADPGVARQVLGAAYAKGDAALGLKALEALEASLGDEVQRGAFALDAARVLQRMGNPERALVILDTARSHPLVREGEARLLHAAKRWEDAASTYQDAATRAKDRHRSASLWREAAVIFEEELADRGRAVDAWVRAADCDIAYLDVYRRLAGLYRSLGQLDSLAALTDARIDAGADTPTLVGLLLEKARQRRERGDLDGVIEALDECLELDPHHFAALRELVDTCRAAEDWQGAAEALIRIARLNRSTDEQVWAFAQLAETYDVHLHDLPRAEASLRRVARLVPTNLESLDRLASVLSRQDKAREAASLLEELARRASNDAQRRDYRIRLACAVEAAGEARQAELMLENLRAEQPAEPDVILSLADYYQRQGAGPAEAMHLNRAVSDLRTAIEAHPGDEGLWTTLVRVLDRRHGAGPASCAASAAIAIGHPASLFEGDATGRGEALGEAVTPLPIIVDAIVAPSALPPTARRLFALCEQSFDKILPFDADAWRLRKPAGPHRELIEEAGAVAEVLGISEPRLKVTYVAPAACMPIAGNPPTIVVGGKLHQITTSPERVFLFARALKIASNHLAPALRARPEDLDAALLALLHRHDTGHAPQQETQPRQDLRRRLLRAVPRRWRDEVESLILELRGSAGFSTRAIPFGIAEFGNHAALTLTGDVPAAVNALLKIAGHDVPPGAAARLSSVRENPEAWAVIRFAISDAHFEARSRAGVDP